jgi:hypothetical protein
MEADVKRWFVCSFAALMAACGTSANPMNGVPDAAPDATGGPDGSTDGSSGGGPDATAEDASDAAEDVAAADATDGSASCPQKQPRDGDPCTGSASCQYGHTVCCGMNYSQFTCVCQQGSYSCAMTVECNIVCSDGGPTDAGGG